MLLKTWDFLNFFAGVSVPVVLLVLKDCLLKNNGLSKPGIFKTPGDQSRIKQFKQSLNMRHNLSVTDEDAYSVAHLIKVFTSSINPISEPFLSRFGTWNFQIKFSKNFHWPHLLVAKMP